MKTIEIQNCTEYRDNLFKVFINGEKHIVRYQSKIQVPDNKPFEIKEKYIWGCSPKYTFEPKDNMLLQIFVNKRKMDISFGLMAIAMVFVIVNQMFLGEELFLYISQALWLLVIIRHFIIIRKNSYTIHEIQKDKIYEND